MLSSREAILMASFTAFLKEMNKGTASFTKSHVIEEYDKIEANV